MKPLSREQAADLVHQQADAIDVANDMGERDELRRWIESEAGPKDMVHAVLANLPHVKR